MRYLFILLFILIAIPAHAETVVPISSLLSGDLIRGQTFPAVYYYGEDGFRYVFPNDKTFFTWYDNFSEVKWVSDKELASIQIGGNVTYKPGIKMLKINSDPKVYAVSTGGILRPIASENIATSLYGPTWNQYIDDVPDGFFPNYKIGGTIEFASQYSAAVEKTDAASINDDKNLQAAMIIAINETSYEPSTITISAGTAVRFVNTATKNQSASEWDGIWGTGTLKPGQHFTRYFEEKGIWTFYSKYTPTTTMTGTLIVK